MRIFLSALALLTGCGHALEAKVRDLEAKLATSERTRGDLGRKVEELEGRVFLLTDKLENDRVEQARRGKTPRLPVVTLEPAPAPPAPVEPARTIDDGEPAPNDLPRPMLRLEGRPLPPSAASPSTSATRLRTSASATTVSAATVPPIAGDMPNLGVVKLTDRGIPKRPDDGALPSLTTTASAPTAMTNLTLSSTAATTPAKSEGPASLYRAAYAQLMAGHIDEAAGSFRDFVRRFPNHEYADNAQYWLGETFYARKDYPTAAPEFRRVIDRWPTGNKAPDALLKLGYCLLAMQRVAEGRETLLQVAEQYPKTEAATLAGRRLAELPTAPREAKKR